MRYTIADISSEIFLDLDQPSDLILAVIAQWLRNNIGKLNILIGSCYDIDSTTFEFTPDISLADKSVFKKIYELKWVNSKILSTLGAAGTSSVLEVTSDGASVKRINTNEIAKSWIQLRKEITQELKDLLKEYKISSYTPLQVFGDDVSNVPAILPVNYGIRTIFDN